VNVSGSVASFVGMFLFMIGITLVLRQRNVLRTEHASLLSALLIDVVWPLLIFSSVARASIEVQDLAATSAVIGAEVCSCVLSYLLGRWILRLDRSALGAFVIAATFGSTSLIGNALVQVLFHDNPALGSMSMIIGQFGVGIPGNTIGVFLAMHFGAKGSNVSFGEQFRKFITMPPTLALFLGIVWTTCKLPVSGVGFDVVFGGCKMVSTSLPFISAMVVGLSLRALNVRRDLVVLGAGAILALVVEPLIADQLLGLYPVGAETRLIAILFSAMPSSPLGVVMAVRFGGDTALAGKLATFTLLMSAVTLPLIALL
jgi:predicted permease